MPLNNLFAGIKDTISEEHKELLKKSINVRGHDYVEIEQIREEVYYRLYKLNGEERKLTSFGVLCRGRVYNNDILQD